MQNNELNLILHYTINYLISVSVVLGLSQLIVRTSFQYNRSWCCNIYARLLRNLDDFRGTEIVSRLTEENYGFGGVFDRRIVLKTISLLISK